MTQQTGITDTIMNNFENTLTLRNREEVIEFLNDNNFKSISKNLLTQTCVSLENFDFDDSARESLPHHFAERYRAVPLMIHQNRLVLAMAEHSNALESIKSIQFLTGHRVEVFTTTTDEVDLGIEKIYGSHSLVDFSENIQGFDTLNESHETPLADIMRQVESKPIVQLVTRIIHEAVRKKASDIHIRPTETG